MSVAPWSVWWADLSPTRDTEQAGLRPAIVVSSPLHLRLTRGQLVSILPVTTRHRPGWNHHVPVSLSRPSFALTEQVRTISVNRLTQEIGELSDDEIVIVRASLRRMLDV